MYLIAKVIRISHAKFHSNRLTNVQDIQDYESLIFGTPCRVVESSCGSRPIQISQHLLVSL